MLFVVGGRVGLAKQPLVCRIIAQCSITLNNSLFRTKSRLFSSSVSTLVSSMVDPQYCSCCRVSYLVIKFPGTLGI